MPRVSHVIASQGGGGGGGVLEVYLTGGPTELHIANPKKYTSQKF